MKTPYEHLVEKAEEMGLPRNYKNDLFIHDCRILAKPDAPKTFGWVLRENGTHLFSPATADDPHISMGKRDGDYREALARAVRFFEGQSGQYHYFFWDGRQLESCATAKKMLERLLAVEPDYRKCQCWGCRKKAGRNDL